ncbi:hypothetical protein B296_00022094, partial [Ensete ventricosum]
MTCSVGSELPSYALSVVICFAKGIRKLAGNTPGDHRKKIERFTARMPEAVGLVG